jgi:hypothetical protein
MKNNGNNNIPLFQSIRDNKCANSKKLALSLVSK